MKYCKSFFAPLCILCLCVLLGTKAYAANPVTFDPKDSSVSELLLGDRIADKMYNDEKCGYIINVPRNGTFSLSLSGEVKKLSNTEEITILEPGYKEKFGPFYECDFYLFKKENGNYKEIFRDTIKIAENTDFAERYGSFECKEGDTFGIVLVSSDGDNKVEYRLNMQTDFVSEISDKFIPNDPVRIYYGEGSYMSTTEKDYYITASDKGYIELEVTASSGWSVFIFEEKNGSFECIDEMNCVAGNGEAIKKRFVKGVNKGDKLYIGVRNGLYGKAEDAILVYANLDKDIIPEEYDVNNTFESARTITTRSQNAGLLYGSENREYYRIVAPAEGTMNISLTTQSNERDEGWNISFYKYQDYKYFYRGSYTVDCQKDTTSFPTIGCHAGDVYYICVEHTKNSKVSYKINSSFTVAGYSSMEEPVYEKELNDSFDTAEQVYWWPLEDVNECNFYVDANIFGEKDIDYYYHVLSRDGAVVFDLGYYWSLYTPITPECIWLVTLYRKNISDGSIEKVGFNKVKSGDRLSGIQAIGGNKGDIIYMSVEWGSGDYGTDYSVSVTEKWNEEAYYTYEIEKNDYYDGATDIVPNEKVYGHITSHAGVDPVDIYRFTTVDHEEISFMLTTEDATANDKWNICLYKSVNGDKKQIMSQDGNISGGLKLFANGNEEYFLYICNSYVDEGIDYTLKLTSNRLNVTYHPESQEWNIGENGSFTAGVRGDVKSYQWMMSSDGINWKEYEGQGAKDKRIDFTVTKDLSAYRFKCILTDLYDNKYETRDAGILIPLTIIRQPESVVVSESETAEFRVVVRGFDRYDPWVTDSNYPEKGYSYQWQYKFKADEEWKDWKSKTTSIITVPYDAKKNGMYLRCYIDDHSGLGKYTDEVTLTYKKPAAAPRIGKNPTDSVVDKDRSAKFTVTATGDELTYQWQYKLANGTTFKDWAGKTSATINVPYDAKKNGILLRCKIIDKYGNEIISEPAKLSYITGPDITRQPADVCVAAGHAAPFSVKAEGTGLKYQWQYKLSNGTTFKDWAGKTTASITVPYDAKKNGMQLQCVITDTNGGKTVSSIAKLSYSDSPVVMVQPVDVTVESGHAAPFQVKVSGDGTLTYQWQYKLANGTTFKDWAGKTTGLIKVPYDAKKDGMQLQCVVTDGNGKKVTSGIAVLRYTK